MAVATVVATVAEIKDLGVMEGPVLVFGGAYSNFHALQAMLDKAKSLGIPTDRVIHTGDVVAYCAQPRETSEFLKSSGVHCLMGNCEESIGAGSGDCGCGFEEGSTCDEYSKNWFAHTMVELKDSPDLKTWMGSLPKRLEFTVGGKRFAVVHGSPSNISRFMWKSMSSKLLQEEFDLLPTNIDGILSGHSGIPFAEFVPARNDPADAKARLWINAGVIGMPANDGTQRGWYVILTPRAADMEVAIHSLDYDAAAAADAIFARPNLVRGYADSLRSGIWPSHDVLSVEDQMETGVPLKEQTVLWPNRVRPQTGAHCSPMAIAVGLAVATLALVAQRSLKPASAA